MTRRAMRLLRASCAEAARLLKEYRPNALDEEKISRLERLIGYFWGPMPKMIGIAAIVSAIWDADRFRRTVSDGVRVEPSASRLAFNKLRGDLNHGRGHFRILDAIQQDARQLAPQFVGAHGHG